MAGGDLLEAHHQSDVSCKERHPVDPNGTPPRTPPRTRAERLACGLPAYVNRNLDLLAAPRDIPQVFELIWFGGKELCEFVPIYMFVFYLEYMI